MKKTFIYSAIIIILISSLAYYNQYQKTWRTFAKYEDSEGGQYNILHKGTNDYCIEMFNSQYQKSMKFNVYKAVKTSETELKLNFARENQSCIMVIPVTLDTTKKAFLEVDNTLAFYLTTINFPEGAKDVNYNEPDNYKIANAKTNTESN